MADSRYGNYQSCCRLCLSDKTDSLKSVFDDTTADSSLPQKILAFVTVEITSNDKISTLICVQCIEKINSWHGYKEECSENQNKLENWLQMWTNTEMADMSIQIKEEPVGDEDEATDVATESLPIVKAEPIEIIAMDEDYDYPPPLTPHPPERYIDVTDEESQTSTNSVGSKSESKKCSTCDKTFSTPGNRKKHEKQMICRKTPMGSVSSADERSQASVDSQPITEVDAELQKIQFAAGLKLLQTNETPIAFEPLSKIELSYIDKCKAMASMYKTLECACHKVAHPNLKGLLSHLRSLRIWFPVFTCYNCMITFVDRSSFTRHNLRCHKTSTESLIKLSNLRKRSEVKTRLYQNFKCTSCKYMYTFHDEFCKHVNEEHVLGEAPFQCTCTRTFTDVEEYKDHIFVSCLVEFYCDICFVTVKTLDAFKKHAAEIHDNAEGFTLLQDDNYRTRKSLVRQLAPPSEPVILTTKRRSSFYNKAPILEPELDDEKPSPTKVPNPTISRKKPTACPICPKVYSNYANMVRHYRTHTKAEINRSRAQNKQALKNHSTYYSCPDCNGMYDANEWRKHLAEKHENLNCSECGKIFQFKSELDQHRSVHLNLKVYRDSKTKSYKSTMLSPNSDGEIPLLCEICDSTFESPEELNNHKLEHESMPLLAASTESEVTDNAFKCNLCDVQFSGYNGLWEHNKQNHPNIRTPQSKAFPKQCKYCDKLFYTGGSYFMHQQMHEKIGQKLIKMEESTKLTIPTKGKRHTIEEDDDEESSYHTCKRCFKVFSSKYSLRNHMRSHGINLSPHTKATTKIKSKKVWCESCHIICDNLESLEKHKQEEHDIDDMPTLSDQNTSEDSKDFIFTCDICVMTFTTKIALKKHKEKHTQEIKTPIKTSIYCKYCKIGFESVVTLNKHMVVKHSDAKGKRNSQFSCGICRKTFQAASALYAHQGWHKRVKSSPSGKPGKVLKQVKIINKMTKPLINPPAVVKPPEFQCTTCLAELPNDTALQIHILEKHRNVNAIMLIPRCNNCNLDFKTQDEYDTHKRFHDFLERQQMNSSNNAKQSPVQVTVQKIKSFPCSYCTAGFSRADTLNSHIRQHHKDFFVGEFKCTQCDRVFDKQNSLSIHLKVHEKQKSSKPLFSCSICNMGFDLPKDLRTHTISAHPF